jgi:lysophospholipase L1-like esterase
MIAKVFVLGDSISMQYGPYLEQYVAGKFHYARKTGSEGDLDDPQGANGGDSSMVLSYLRSIREVGRLEADVLVLNCGLHDIKTNPSSGRKQISLSEYRQNLQQILQIAADMMLKVVWVRTTPVMDTIHNSPRKDFHRHQVDVDAYNRAADEIMSESGVRSIDLHTFTKNLGDNLYCDHVHYHEPIRQQQAAYIAGWLEGWFAKK